MGIVKVPHMPEGFAECIGDFASSGKNVCVALIADTYIRDPAQGR